MPSVSRWVGQELSLKGEGWGASEMCCDRMDWGIDVLDVIAYDARG